MFEYDESYMIYAQNIKRLCLVSLLWCVFFVSESAQIYAGQKTIESVIAEKVEIIRQNPHAGLRTEDVINNYSVDSVITQAINLTKDSEKPVKEFGYQLLLATGKKHDTPDLRKIIVNVLVNGLSDEEKGITTFCSKMLLKYYQKTDFSAEARNRLKQHFDEIVSKKSYGHYYENILLLIGAANMQEEMNRLQTVINQVDEPLKPIGPRVNPRHKMAFAALKAKARMGDPNAIQRCISLVDTQPTDENIKALVLSKHFVCEDFRALTLLKHIAYIRQPEAVNYIKLFLYSDEKSRDLGPDCLGERYAYSAAIYLEEMVVGLPKAAEMANHIMKYGFDKKFMEKWPTYRADRAMAHVLNCRKWLEAQISIEIIR